jgi:beta-aspartyl-dipeptidase (metallo-type)
LSFTLIKNGEVYAPAPMGIQSILVDDEKILKVGSIDEQKVQDFGIETKVIDAEGGIVIPGIIDPHSHIIGAGGEQGFASHMPELEFNQMIGAGITTVVGLLGTDTITRNLKSLYAKTRQYFEEGLTAFMYTGGFEIPVTSITGSIKDDIVIIAPVIGTGEIAISDSRWIDPELHSLAVVVAETRLGGMQAKKAGVTHFHTGEGKQYLCLLHSLLDQYNISAEYIYATHVERSEPLIEDAIRLAKRGGVVDMDTVDEKLHEHLQYYLQHGGPADHLTVSSDANTPGGRPRKLFDQLRACVLEARMPLQDVLPHFTSNTAKVLKFETKGSLEAKKDADILILDKDALQIQHLLARGQQMIQDGQIIKQSLQKKEMEESGR